MQLSHTDSQDHSANNARKWIIAAIAVVALAAALMFFKPWTLFTNTTVDDALPTGGTSMSKPAEAGESSAAGASDAMDSATPEVVAQGEFVTHAHTTTGKATIYKLADGRQQLALENLSTDNGPDVHLWVSANDVSAPDHDHNGAKNAEHIDLGLIKGNKGNQVYDLPADFDASKWHSVDLWCAQFSVSFGAAPLQ